MRSYLENQSMVNIKQFWVVVFVLAKKKLKTRVLISNKTVLGGHFRRTQ